MKHQKSLLKPIALALLSLAASAAFAQDKEAMTIPESDTGKLSIGLKFWNANWESKLDHHYRLESGDRYANIQTMNANEITVTPTIQYKYKDFAISFSTLLSKNFSTTKTLVTSTVAGEKFSGYNTFDSEYIQNRKEYDINFSYFIKSNISASLGYKRAEFGTVKWEGPIIGLSASAPLTENISLYSNIGLGKMNYFGEFSSPTATYGLIETGIAYSLHEWVKNSAITFSYRQQEIKSPNLVNGGSSLGVSEFTDTTRGVAIGFTKSF